MAVQKIAPRADQPRVATSSLKSAERSPNLQYRVQGVQNYSRAPKTRSTDRGLTRSYERIMYRMKRKGRKSRR